MKIQLESLRFDAKLAHALSHQFRIDLLEALQGGEASHLQLSDQMSARSGQRAGRPDYVLYHLKVLASAGCIERVRSVTEGPRQAVYYRAVPNTFIGGREWSKVPRSLLGSVQGRSVETFANELTAALEAGGVGPREGTLTWMAVTVDAQGQEELKTILRAAQLRLVGVHDSTAKRLRMAHFRNTTTMIVGLAGFQSARSNAVRRL